MKNQITDTLASLTSDSDPVLLNGMFTGFVAGLALALKDPLFAGVAQLRLVNEWTNTPGMPKAYGPSEMADILLRRLKAEQN